MNDSDRQVEKEHVRSRTPIAELVAELTGAELRSRGGDDLWACCPFHAEDTASFHVRPRLGLFKCFGCGASGDIFSFVQEIRGVDFREALQFLAERVGVTLGSLTTEERRAAVRSRRLREALEVARELFGNCLAQAGNPAREYMVERGFTAETLDAFDVGWVPADFRQRLVRQGLPSDALEAAGFTGAFGERVSFGIRDGHGGLVGFGARTLRADGAPKYVNTRETAAFNKRSLLYGLHLAGREAVRSRRLVVMEGYTDVMMAHQRGVQDAVATMGTSFTNEHARSLPSRVDNLVLLFDGDRAGSDAAERAVRLLLVRGAECRVLHLPDGQDPCDWFASHDSDDLGQLLATCARSTVSFLCRRELARLDPGQPGGREAAARKVLEACRPIVDPVRREGIAAEVARECGADRNLLRQLRRGGSPSLASVTSGRLPLKATVRSQCVLLAGLVHGGDRADDLVRLHARGAIDHPAVLRLIELAGGLAAAPVDPSAWLERVRDVEPRLVGWLEGVLHPHPDEPPMSHEQSREHLESMLSARLEREARLVALSVPDLASDAVALRALDESLRAARNSERSDNESNGRAKPTGGRASPNPTTWNPQAESETW